MYKSEYNSLLTFWNDGLIHSEKHTHDPLPQKVDA